MIQSLVSTDHIRNLLKQVKDPEVPVLDIEELGVLRNVHYENDKLIIEITPTYNGCPALNTIREDIQNTMKNAGFTDFRISVVLSPAWTTDWLTREAKQKLQQYGIAPPSHSSSEVNHFSSAGKLQPVTCPYCHSKNTLLKSAFGSTACKALHFCNECRQPFEEFKCH